MYNTSFLDTGEFLLQALELEREPFVINTKGMQHSGVKITDMDRIFDDVVAVIIGLPVVKAWLDTTTR